MNFDRRNFLGALGLLLAGCATERRPALVLVPAPQPPQIPPTEVKPLPLPPVLPALVSVVNATRLLLVVPGRWQIIVGHHSGIGTGNAAIYDRAHRLRGMEHGLAYHFVIGNGTKSGDGEIELGGRWLKQLPGGHVRNEHVNQIGIGICCVGNFEEITPTPAQLRSFTALVECLKRDVLKTPVRFAVHREIDPGRTVCPGRHFPVAALRQRLG